MMFRAPIGLSTIQSKSSLKLQALAAVKESIINGIKAEGSYPVSIKLIDKLSILLGEREPQFNEIIDLILIDPILSLRLVSLANFPAYSRGRPTVTLGSALQQYGIKKITEIIKGLSHNKNFEKAYKDRAIAIRILNRISVTIIIANYIAHELLPQKSLAEEISVIVTAAMLPELLTAFYVPHLYASCWMDSFVSKFEFYKSFRKLFRQSLLEYAQEINSGLSMPKECLALLKLLENPPWNKRTWIAGEGMDQKVLSKSIYAAQQISQKIFQYSDIGTIDKLINDICGKLALEKEKLLIKIANLPEQLGNIGEHGGFLMFRLPEYFTALDSKYRYVGKSKVRTVDPKLNSKVDRLGPFLGELKSSFEDELEPLEVTQLDRAIMSTLLAMVEALDFDRSVLLVPDPISGVLKATAWFGNSSPLVNNYRQKVVVSKFEFKPDLQAFHEGRAIFNGDPLFGDDWPFAAFPIVCQGKSLAVFYGDRASKPMAQPLDTAEQVAIVALAEAWQNIPISYR